MDRTSGSDALLELLEAYVATKGSVDVTKFQSSTEDVRAVEALSRGVADIGARIEPYMKWPGAAGLGRLYTWTQSRGRELASHQAFRSRITQRMLAALADDDTLAMGAIGEPGSLEEIAGEVEVTIDADSAAQVWEVSIEHFLTFFREARERQEVMDRHIRSKKSRFSIAERKRVIEEEFGHHIEFDTGTLLDWVERRIAEVEGAAVNEFETIQSLLTDAEKHSDDEDWDAAASALARVLEIKTNHQVAAAKLKQVEGKRALYEQLSAKLAVARKALGDGLYDDAQGACDQAATLADTHAFGPKARASVEEMRGRIQAEVSRNLEQMNASQREQAKERLIAQVQDLLQSRRWDAAAGLLAQGADLMTAAETTAFNAAIKRGRTWSTHLRAGDAAAAEGRFEDAATEYAAADKLMPSPEIRERLERMRTMASLQETVARARGLGEAGDWAEAVTLWRQVAASTEDPELKLEASRAEEELVCARAVERGEVCASKGDHAGAIEAYQEAIRLRRRDRYLLRLQEFEAELGARSREARVAALLKRIRTLLEQWDGQAALQAVRELRELDAGNQQLAGLETAARDCLTWDEKVKKANGLFASRDWENVRALYADAAAIRDTPELQRALAFLDEEIEAQKTLEAARSARSSGSWDEMAQHLERLPGFVLSQTGVREQVETMVRTYVAHHEKLRRKAGFVAVAAGGVVAVLAAVVIAVL